MRCACDTVWVMSVGMGCSSRMLGSSVCSAWHCTVLACQWLCRWAAGSGVSACKEEELLMMRLPAMPARRVRHLWLTDH